MENKKYKHHTEEKALFEAEDLIKQAIERHKPNIYVAFSGGKCSEVVLHMALKYWKDIPVMFNNTGVEFPETIEFIQKLKKEWKLNLIETHPEKTFWDCVKKYGIPSIKSASQKKHGSGTRPKCCYHLKEKPALLEIRKNGFKACMTGIRGEESYNRRNLMKFCGQRYYQKTWGIWKYHPIIFWEHKQMEDYIKQSKLPINQAYLKWNGLYKRVGCLPCTSYKDWKVKLQKSHPQLYHRLQNIDGTRLLSQYPELNSEGKFFSSQP